MVVHVVRRLIVFARTGYERFHQAKWDWTEADLRDLHIT